MHRRYHFIQFPVVHSHPPRAIRLPYKPHRELNGLCAGRITSTFASSATVAPISLWPPDRHYCLTATALQGFSNTYGGCFAYPLMTAFTTRTWRWNSPTDIHNTRPFKTSYPEPSHCPVYTLALIFAARLPAFVFPPRPGTETRPQTQRSVDCRGVGQ